MVHMIEYLKLAETGTLTARKIKYLKLAEMVPYTKKELSLLKNMLDDAWVCLNYHDPDYGFLQDFYEDISFALSIECRGGKYFIEGKCGLNFMQYLLISFPKVYIFLTCVKSESVLLYLNKKGFVGYDVFIHIIFKSIVEGFDKKPTIRSPYGPKIMLQNKFKKILTEM